MALRDGDANVSGKGKVNSVNQQVAGNFFGVPKDVRDAAKHGTGKNYTIKDKTSHRHYKKKVKHMAHRKDQSVAVNTEARRSNG